MYTSIMRHVNIPVTLAQHEACRVLEALGKRFCVDYGYENAEGILADYLEWVEPIASPS